ncbi:MarR family winged helix-turn-helix transcriptional regulator [Amycolatopsis aidingensis]|uniref:MarR family winged helix-turn-helix transcriptional regulator n=1 Tax=Amycolatopsis aidingensis TaxID=2842453 RepID=UPI001C0D966B|nr:MarR family transcriptional regulator [Amycolatopsis aidingensis]
MAEALTATRQLHSATEELLDAAAERYGINRNDLRCLEILEREGPMQPGRLAQVSGLSPAAVTKVLDRLERAGYVIRPGAGADRRARPAQVSERHPQRRREIWQPVIDAAHTALAGQSPEQVRALTAVLTGLAEANHRSARYLRRC